MADHDDYPYLVIERREGGIGPFFLGAMLGAGLALLFAPRTGEETREELRAGVTRLRERAEGTVRDLQDTVTDTIGTVRGEVTDRLEAAREAFEAGRQAARSTRSDMEQRVNDVKAGVRAGIDAARRSGEPENAAESDLGV